jgi:hybrid cluster-associated redox disulfide protein
MVKKKEALITKEMPVMEALARYPEIVPILMGYGLHCVGCHFASFDTLEKGAKMHGMDDETISMMVKDANLLIERFADFNKSQKSLNNSPSS